MKRIIHTRAIKLFYGIMKECGVEDSANDSDSISEYLSDYLTYGLRDFSKFDKIPVTLKAMLFNRYAKNAYSMKDAVSGFKEFYQKYYK